jgi:hypothetical protein
MSAPFCPGLVIHFLSEAMVILGDFRRVLLSRELLAVDLSMTMEGSDYQDT